ncbi:MAG: hypothetical protein KBF42_11500 [Chitinophagales bacterium]|jgi:hypothetical protein|nr:hypothetical protein [Bacteroidota bacterium]MBK7568866.1 hypothetical protein [Bacteroidota bacterium]MBP8915401.1 hypothetical protein [Chitinophagales bacterium]MBP9222004.1 hypothetical protein [Chitinophagales bacterium]MBP9796937.1 hypothetical protein [Chitinophagales bacterium]
MLKKELFSYFLIGITILLFSCNKEVKNFNDIHFVLEFDEDQIRLDNLGNPSVIPAGNAAQTPLMNLMSVHYIELSENEFVPFKDGAVLYTAPQTSEGGDEAIDFDESQKSAAGADFVKINLERLAPGTYKYVRVSVAYQNYDIQYNINDVPFFGDLTGQTGTAASFLGFNTYISDLTVKNLTTTINANKLQGFWAFESLFTDDLEPYNAIYTGQAPEGATTVVNPLDATSPVPEGSCVITGAFAEPLIIDGSETSELFIYLSFSINNSFEWIDPNANGKWDLDASVPANNEAVVDMGLRGLLPSWEWKD